MGVPIVLVIGCLGDALCFQRHYLVGCCCKPLLVVAATAAALLLVDVVVANTSYGAKNPCVFCQVGMTTSNEPGYYEDGKFGIRIEK